MEKAKRSPFIKIASIMLGASLLMTCVISGTLAKYTSAATGTASATVAKWSVEFSGTDIATNDNVAFSLFDTVKEADGTTAEADVAAGKIAPGTGGSFDLKIENKSEVNATYSVALTETNNSNVPIEYSADNGTSWKALSDLNVTDKAIAIGASETIKIQWRWVFEKNEAGNTTDTALGTATTAPTVGIAADFTATQVD